MVAVSIVVIFSIGVLAGARANARVVQGGIQWTDHCNVQYGRAAVDSPGSRGVWTQLESPTIEPYGRRSIPV
jgi:hypothetical protein